MYQDKEGDLRQPSLAHSTSEAVSPAVTTPAIAIAQMAKNTLMALEAAPGGRLRRYYGQLLKI